MKIAVGTRAVPGGGSSPDSAGAGVAPASFALPSPISAEPVQSRPAVTPRAGAQRPAPAPAYRAHDNGKLPCAWCGAPTPALVNGKPACRKHLHVARKA